MTPILALIRPLNKATGARVDIRAGSAAEATAYSLNNGGWERMFTTRPRITQALMSPDLDGKLQLPSLDTTITLRQMTQFGPYTDLYWTGAPITIWSVADLAWDRRKTEFFGLLDSAKLDLDTMQLSLSATGDRTRLDRPLLTAEFTGGGGALGDPGMRGTKKPAGFGVMENIEWVVFDATYNIGMLDGYGNLLSVQRCMEGLNDLGAPVANYANYAALKSAIVAGQVPKGRWATCIAEGMVGLGAPPAGRITFNATFGSTKPGAIIQRWLTVHAQNTVDQLDVASFNAIDAAIGYDQRAHFKDQQQVSDLIEQMCRPLNCTPIVLPNGLISVTRAGPSSPVATLNRRGGSPRATDWKVTDPIDPIYQVAYRAARPGVVMSYDEVNYVDDIIDRGLYSGTETYRAGHLVWLANGSSWLYINATPAAGHAPPTSGTADAWWQRLTPPNTAADFTYSTGQTLESLRPQEAGANVTEARQALGFQGEGALARLNTADWATRVANRPTELTDGRVSTALTSTGTLKGGLDGAGQTVTMTDTFAALAGTNLAVNPELYNGSSTGWQIYNNAGGTKTAISVVADALAPNSSGYVLRVSYDGTGTPNTNPTPGFGGAVQTITDGGGVSKPGFYARNTTLLFKVIAKVPVGRTINYAGNAIGTGASVAALTPMVGTGDWQTYIWRLKIGNAGTFSSTGYLYVTGGTNVAFTWDIAKFDQIDLTSAARVFMGRTMMDEQGIARFQTDLVTLLGNAMGFTGEGTLARKNNVGASDIVVPTLSAIVANLGTITSGFMQSPSGNTQIDLSNARQLFNNGTVMLAMGVAFGSTNQFVLWFGPTQASYGACTEANAIFYLKTNGQAYFGGSLSAGTLTTKAQTSSLSATASVDTGTFGSNGNQIQATASYTHRTQDDTTYPATTTGLSNFNAVVASLGATSSDGGSTYNAAGASGESVDLYLDKNGSQVATIHLTGSYTWTGTKPVPGDSAPGSGRFVRTMGGSTTFNDPVLSTADRAYQARIANRVLQSTTAETQNVAVIAVEQ